MIDTTVTELLLDDLRRRVRRTVDPIGQAVALRAFLESVHKAMGKLLGFDPKTVHIDRWFDWMNKVAVAHNSGITVHPDTYSPLSITYRQGNISAHENKEALQVTSTRCHERCQEVCDLMTSLVAQMSALHLDLEAAVLRERETATHLHRAQKLFDAIGKANGDGNFDGDVWPVVEAVLAPISEKWVNGLRKNPVVEKRVRQAVVVCLAQRAEARDSCPLRQLARGLRPTADIEQWLLDDNAHLALLRQQPRLLNLFRIELDASSSSEAGTIRSAAMYDSQGHRVNIPGTYPIESRSSPELFRAIIQLFKMGSIAQRERGGATPEPREFVLQIAVQKECSMRDWESFKRPGPYATLADEFLAVAVDPLDEDDSNVDLYEPLDATRMAFVWEKDPSTIRQQYRAQSVFLAGPPTWQTDLQGLPPILYAMSQRAAAVLLPELEEETARLTLGIDDREAGVIWADLVIKLGELKRGVGSTTPGAYRIFLTDARYSAFAAYST